MKAVVWAVVVLVVTTGSPNTGLALEEADIQALMDKISEMQAQIDALARQVAETSAKTEEAAQMSEATVEMVENLPSMNQASSWADSTTVGGYGELHYNSLDSGSEVDFHRFVLFVNHQFNDNICSASNSRAIIRFRIAGYSSGSAVLNCASRTAIDSI